MPATTTRTRLQLQLLGPFVARAGGADGPILPISAMRHRALIAYLAIQPGACDMRDRVATLIWGDSPDDRARQSLRQALLTLRKQLGEIDLIIGDRKLACLNPELIEADAVTFRTLAVSQSTEDAARALELYQGDFLQGFTTSIEALNGWLADERDRHRALFHQALQRYVGAKDGSPEKALKALNRAASLARLDQPLHILLVRYLAGSRQEQAALTTAEAFVRRLKRELDEEPDEDLKALMAELRVTSVKEVRTPVQVTSMAQVANRPAGGLGPLFEGVPPRALNFTGRHNTLSMLHALLNDDVGASSVDCVAVAGLGGIGKTSLAVEYAHRYRASYSGIWWVRAAQRTALVESLASLAAASDPRLAAQTDPEKAAHAVLRLLPRQQPPFLLIYDDVETPAEVRDFLPPSNVKALISTRWPDWVGLAMQIKLDAFDDDVAVEFLQKRAGRFDPAAAHRLARALGNLPLALDQAAAYCKLTTMGFDTYLSRLDLQLRRAPKGSANATSIAATFELAFERSERSHPASVWLLGVLSYLAPERIPLSLIPEARLDSETKAEAIAALYSVSLLDPTSDAGGTTLASIHPLVQAAMRLRNAERDASADHLAVAAELLAEKFPASALSEIEVWPLCALLLPHVLALRGHVFNERLFVPAVGKLLHRAAEYLHIRGSYQSAEDLYRDALVAHEASGSGKPADIVTVNSDLALLLSTMGRYAAAEPLLRDAIAKGQRMLGRQHLEVARRMNNLAKLLSDTKRYDEAEPLLRHAIKIADHKTRGNMGCALAWRNNLGILLNETRRNAEGKVLYLEALQLGEKAMGSHHHEVARTMNNLGRLLRDTGRLDEADRHVRKALAIWSETIGTTHPIYARGQENLAMISFMNGDVTEALDLARAALQVHESTLGRNHFWSRDSARTCARAYKALGLVGEMEAVTLRYGLGPIST